MWHRPWPLMYLLLVTGLTACFQPLLGPTPLPWPTPLPPPTVAPSATSHAAPTATPPRLAIYLIPRSVLADEATAIRVTGLQAGQTVTLTASMRNDLRRHWESFAVFVSDDAGVVDLTTHVPVTGTYSSVAPMGLIWSMVPRLPGEAIPAFASFDDHYMVVTLTAETDREEVATAYLERHRRGETVTEEAVAEDGLVGIFYTPGGAGPYPAVITLGGSGGSMDVQKAVMLASRGYAALALDYFGGQGLPNQLSEIPLEYFADALAWLQAHPAVDGERIGVIGNSRGGELALLLGATYPEIKAVVSYAGSGVVFGGYPDPGPAWTVGGEPVPFAPAELDLAQERDRPAFVPGPAEELVKAVIPVEQINGPVLLISGTADRVWPASMLSEIAWERLAAHDHPYPYAHLFYEEAGHTLPVPYWPTTVDPFPHPVTGVIVEPGGTRATNAVAGAEAWAEVLDFLEAALAP
jgi:dienelactone hydrolase